MAGVDEEDWVARQKRTFTNWINVTLAERNVTINDLETDFMDGSSLCHLAEVCSKKKIPGGFKKSHQTVQSGSATTKDRQFARLAQANLEKALNFLVDDEGLKLVNVGCFDIVDGNTKIILGLVWQIILKYHIAEGAQAGMNVRVYKEQLLLWVNTLVGKDTAYGLEVTNFKRDWKYGKVLQALVDAFCHRAFENWNDDGVDTEGWTAKNEAAIVAASDLLGIPGIIAPMDVGYDDLSLIAYIDYYQDFDEKNKVLPRKVGEGYGGPPKPANTRDLVGQVGNYTGKRWGQKLSEKQIKLSWH